MKRSKINLKGGLFVVFASFLWLLPSVATAQSCAANIVGGSSFGSIQLAVNAAVSGNTSG